jgi:hypothetical protein
MPSNHAVTLNASRVLNTVGVAPKQMFHGVYLASVVSNNDPLGEGRITMYVPQVLGTAVSNWARPLGYTATDIPAVSSMVHAYFAGGDVNHPIYVKISYATEFANIQTQISNIQPGAWSSLTVQTNWFNIGGYVPAQVRMVLPGVAQITGVLQYTGGVLFGGNTVAILPAGFVYSTATQVIPCSVTNVSATDTLTGPVSGDTDTNGLSDPSIGGDSGIVVAGNAGSNTHEHFPGTYVVNSGQHFHTNLSVSQAAAISYDNFTPYLAIDTAGNMTVWNASENTTAIAFNSVLVT